MAESMPIGCHIHRLGDHQPCRMDRNSEEDYSSVNNSALFDQTVYSIISKMEEIPISGLDELEKHLEVLIENLETPVNAKLFDDVELQLTEHNTPPLIPRLLPKLNEILSNYQMDPAVIVSLELKLLRPLRFTDILSFASEESLIRALESPAPSANILGMTVVEKATKAPSDIVILSNMKGVVIAFLRTWLSSPSVEVGELATRVLGDLLEVDCDRTSAASLNYHMNGLEISSGNPPGQGLLWRRIFQDKDIYSLLIHLCALQTLRTTEIQLDKRQKSLAQGRLLRVLPKLTALDFATISHSASDVVATISHSASDVAAAYGLSVGKRGLLYFAAVLMVDKEDMLMHFTLINFFAEFLDMLSMTPMSGTTMTYLEILMKMVTVEDKLMYKSLESLALSPNSSPELVELLIKLNEQR